MSKPIVIERTTATSGFRVSRHQGRVQIEVNQASEWVRVFFGPDTDGDELAGAIDDARDLDISKRRSRA